MDAAPIFDLMKVVSETGGRETYQWSNGEEKTFEFLISPYMSGKQKKGIVLSISEC